jgi:CHAD domain-containing protein
MPYRILVGEPVGAAVRRIADEQLLKALADIERRDSDPVASVHAVRKRCKALRGLLRLVRPHLDGIYSVDNAFFRDTARPLSDVRDAQVMLDTFDALIEHYHGAVAPLAVSALRSEVEQHKAETTTRQHALAVLQAARPRVEEGRERILNWEIDADGFAAAAGGVERTYRRGRKGRKKARRHPTAVLIHAWRKRSKYHWYHMRLLRDLWPPVMKARVAEVKRLSDLLGDDHDLEVLGSILAERTEGLAEPAHAHAAIGLIERRQQELRAAADHLGQCVYAEKPSALVARLSSLSSAWRRA